jgi:hypothetical protein
MSPRRRTIHLSVFLCFGGALWLSYKVVKVDIPTSGVVRLMRCTSLATGHPPKSMSFAKFVARTSQLEVPPIQIYYVKYLAQSLSRPTAARVTSAFQVPSPEADAVTLMPGFGVGLSAGLGGRANRTERRVLPIPGVTYSVHRAECRYHISNWSNVRLSL